MIKDFKFLRPKNIRLSQLKRFNLNVLNDLFARIPSYGIAFEPYDNNTEDLYGTVGDLINGRLGISGYLVELTIRRAGVTQDTFTSYTIIHYDNVDEVNTRGLIFANEDRIIVKYRTD